MSKGINLRFVCYSLACFAVLAAGGYFLHNWQVKRQSGILLAKAEEAETNGNVGKAIDLYGKYLVLAPKETDAQARYGGLLFDAHAYAPAINSFEAVLRRDSGRSDIRRKAVKADLATGRIPDARDHLENYLLKEFPDDAELLDLEGQCLAIAGEYSAAARSLEAAIERAPTRREPYLHLIAILSRPREDLDKDRDEWLKPLPLELRTTLKQDTDWPAKTADYWSDRLVNSNPKDPPAHVFRGNRRYRKQLWDSAIEDAQAALKLESDDPEALRLAAACFLAEKQLDKAREYATRGIKAAPKDPEMYVIFAQIELASQKPEEAIKWLQMAVDAGGPPRTWWELGSLQITSGKIDAAKQTAQGLRKKTFSKAALQFAASQIGPDLYADLLDADIERAQGHWLEAARQFSQVGAGLKSNPNLAKEAFYSLGKCYDQLADPERALKAYRQAVDADPTWIPAREAIAITLQSLGRFDEAIEEQGTVVRLKDAPLRVWVNLVGWSILRTARLSPETRDWHGVENLLNQMAKLAPKSAAVVLLRSEWLRAQGRGAEAESLLESEKNNNPKDITFWIFLVDLALHENHLDRARKTLDEAQNTFGDRSELRQARLRYLVLKGDKDAVEQFRKLAEESKEISPQDQLLLWRAMIPALLAVNDFPQAERLGRLVMARSPKDLRLRIELFELATQAADVALSDAALHEIDVIETHGPIWHYATALRLIISGTVNGGLSAAASAGQTATTSSADQRRHVELQEALDHLGEALRSRPNWPRALLLEGLVYEDLGQEDTALAKYNQSIEAGNNSPEVARRAVQLLYRKGGYAAANDLLQRLERQQVSFSTELSRDESRVLGGLQDYPGALKAAQRVADKSNDYHDYLWLGQLLGILGRREEAEHAFLKASTLGEKAPETWVALVEFYVRTGQKDRAEQALAQGRDKIAGADAPLALAECLESLGKTAEAGQQYSLALKQRPDDPGVVRSVARFFAMQRDWPKAAEQLERIVAGKISSTPQQLAEARNSLARVRADQGGYRNLMEAVRLVDENLTAGPPSADNLRLKARLLADCPQLSKRNEGMAIFETLVKDPRNALPDDQFRLAQLYLATGNWTKARRQMLALLVAQPNQPQYYATFVQALLQHKEIGEARQWMDHLEEIAPGQITTVQLRAGVQFRAGNAGEAMETLKNFVEKAPANSADRHMRTFAAAIQLEAFGSPTFSADDPADAAAALKRAEELYREYVKEDPKQSVVLIVFLGRHERFDEAIKLAEEAAKTAEPQQIAASCEFVMSQPGMSSPRLQRLSDILTAAIKKFDRKKPLLMAQAEIGEKLEKYSEAEALYREILQADGHFIPALNNLAGLLALGNRRLDEAQNLIGQAITDAGPLPALLDTRASVYMALGQPEKAVVDMQEVLSEHPAANRYFHLAQAQQKLGHKADATDSLMKARAMQIRPESLHPLERPAYEELVHALL